LTALDGDRRSKPARGGVATEDAKLVVAAFRVFGQCCSDDKGFHVEAQQR
jgi:hypothetical protein